MRKKDVMYENAWHLFALLETGYTVKDDEKKVQ